MAGDRGPIGGPFEAAKPDLSGRADRDATSASSVSSGAARSRMQRGPISEKLRNQLILVGVLLIVVLGFTIGRAFGPDAFPVAVPIMAFIGATNTANEARKEAARLKNGNEPIARIATWACAVVFVLCGLVLVAAALLR